MDMDIKDILRLADEQRRAKFEKKYVKEVITKRDILPEDMKPERIGVSIIATGEYTKFIDGFYRSMEEHLLINYQKSLIVFTDDENIELPKDTFRFIIPPLAWPSVVLQRFGIIANQHFPMFDYLLNFDVDLIFKQDIRDIDFLGDTIGVQSPLNIGRDPRDLPFFERRPESACCIPVEESGLSFSASITGGRTLVYQELLRECQTLIDTDLANGITPVGFEESALNRVFRTTPPHISLTPDYLWLEGTRLEPDYTVAKIVSLRKQELDKLKHTPRDFWPTPIPYNGSGGLGESINGEELRVIAEAEKALLASEIEFDDDGNLRCPNGAVIKADNRRYPPPGKPK